MSSRVAVGARLHVGFSNLSLSKPRLYGGIGLALAEPRTVVTASRGDNVECAHETASSHLERVVNLLDVPGAILEVEEALPRHVGLGSGTRLALAVQLAVADVYDLPPRLRDRAPDLGRGGRSGVGVATIEQGGFVVDAGHPTSVFTTEPPERGEWTVPPVTVRRPIPSDWRFVIVIPDAEDGRSGSAEEAAMRTAVEAADSTVSNRVSSALIDRVLPGLATGEHVTFGAGVEAIDRANGEWYADLQGGVYRPPAGRLVEGLRREPATAGAGQSSWGPAVWAVTDEEGVEAVEEAARAALTDVGTAGTVHVTRAINDGVRARNV